MERELTDQEKLQKEIEKLSHREREVLLSKFIFEKTQEKQRLFDREEVALYDAIKREIRIAPSLSIFVQTYGIQKYRNHVKTIFDYIASNGRGLRWPQQVSLLNTIIQCLVEELRRQNEWAKKQERRIFPISPEFLLNNIPLIDEAVNQGFPGYAAAGLLYLIAS